MGGCAGKTNTTPKTTGGAPPLPEEKPATKAPVKGTKAELDI